MVLHQYVAEIDWRMDITPTQVKSIQIMSYLWKGIANCRDEEKRIFKLARMLQHIRNVVYFDDKNLKLLGIDNWHPQQQVLFNQDSNQ